MSANPRTHHELEEENQRLNRLLKAVEWARSLARFHEFKSITNDQCPCCGGPVQVVANEYGHMKLETKWGNR